MKTNRNPKLLRGLAAAVGGFALFTGTTLAAPFLYSHGDLVLTFRQTGAGVDYAVNIGRATNYNNLPPGTSFTVTNLSVAQLNSAFPSVNDLRWSVAGAVRALDVPGYPFNTLWVARSRQNPNVPSTPWVRRSASAQGLAASQVDLVGANAAYVSSTQAAGPDNTATGVHVPINIAYFNLSLIIGPQGNYDDNFPGNVENPTPADFDGDPNNVSRSDLHELLPGTVAGGTIGTPGRYVGYFELKPNGTLTYTAASVAIPAPDITSVVRNGNVTTVSFTTVAGATYRLLSTNAAGLGTPVSTWTVGDSIPGTGAVLSLTDTNTADIRFFAVVAE